MNDKYVIKEFDQVFTAEFMYFILDAQQGNTIEKNLVVQIMRKVEQFEKREQLEFLQFYGYGFIIFKKIEN